MLMKERTLAQGDVQESRVTLYQDSPEKLKAQSNVLRGAHGRVDGTRLGCED